MTETLRAAWVIGRRDFTAIIFSKAFIFFLLGPLFPVAVGVAAGGIGSQVSDDVDKAVIGVMLPAGEAAALIRTREAMAQALGEDRYAELRLLDDSRTPREWLETGGGTGGSALAGVLTGSFAEPRLVTTADQARAHAGELSLLISEAESRQGAGLETIAVDLVPESVADLQQGRVITGQIGQAILFLLVMLLAGMVLSNLVEEKSNKIIEILAAAIPIDAIFLGKLFAMLAMAVTGIAVWGAAIAIVVQLRGGGLPGLPDPAVGWPVFTLLLVVYFATAYLVIGSLFLGIGAMASTVREVQTLSMPATMLQLLVFFFAMYTVTKIGEPIEQIACIFPFSSPFAMIARAAQDATLWHHAVAIAGQILFVLLVVRIGVVLFRRNVMKSGRGGRARPLASLLRRMGSAR